MQYLCLIYSDPKIQQSLSPEENKQFLMDYGTFTADLETSGRYLGSNALQSVHTAMSVRKRNGEVITTDGPFAETKEHLGGYYLVEAKTMEEAAEIASNIPSAKVGTIEVRPIFDWSNPEDYK